ncbi:LOW QUALITY PROTEIN: uncharacterized protein MICPUCDRAFT_70148 [Micromonas pusilla CCMP1545]|uniref:Predicted protein n=1 Tax=Micromonas pusilla (strain CCMP1545) TaxID=564608 RepID=C1N293_MICPC|nr:LOW QUALITY PROTEIN: uncharacterized protein MICPUCDRAFT_70148 [Micromonas pusilla CCMP1545]EEH53964.1 predicted protein [Micromonas pusilla CCMP1545]|eukprot:XP_003062252.1 predicted protein [Micromonas pusilla CCMP1545]
MPQLEPKQHVGASRVCASSVNGCPSMMGTRSNFPTPRSMEYFAKSICDIQNENVHTCRRRTRVRVRRNHARAQVEKPSRRESSQRAREGYAHLQVVHRDRALEPPLDADLDVPRLALEHARRGVLEAPEVDDRLPLEELRLERKRRLRRARDAILRAVLALRQPLHRALGG